VWVDQDGTFYPNNWRNDFCPPIWGGFSLKVRNPRAGAKLEVAERDTLDSFRQFAADKKRLFVLVHGYNNNEAEARGAYEEIERLLVPASGDGVVHFHWDGLTGSFGGQAEIWFHATGYSQLAGMRGLRPILNLAADKDVIVIAHSRGASVFLSALSNPPFSQKFRDRTTWLGDLDATPPLQPGNGIQAILLAPAIGPIDFMPRDYNLNECAERQPFRPMTRLEALQFTVNPCDPTLNKYVFVPGKFNDTRMGRTEAIAKVIKGQLEGKADYIMVKNLPAHGFGSYVRSSEFRTLLERMDLPLRPQDAAPTPRARIAPSLRLAH
jgi:hypothetical protein